MNKDYQLGLLNLAHLLMSADGIIDEKEEAALMRIKSKEAISDGVFREFSNNVKTLKEKEIYQQGIELLNRCSDAEKLNAFAHLCRMSEVDGTVHVKEVRLLLYSVKMASIEFNDVVEKAKTLNY
ncbi:MAG: TerB family tellurite resistance protein [Flammeovirgaceae bacterium]